ncbi:MAG TPA: preprotein translocase subunit SecY [Lysinibacillus sp.]|jgi:preprotein translocase subunit SecY|uniref:Protein translocase subunit SecY n=1 Tax=Lysinibacillus fusiformis TaxID=28031 RepID=A0A2I0UXM6_9BACI|nr:MULTISPECIES: preprotein translocase subunit SecY [Lysinibacillus]HBT72524.1 preprotein translocase subunit SecY [Lysinibacillus sp.]KUF28949.1 preprotein translocase subunit SecY [Lysinibacillus sp. F5]PKU50840.1 preprotein translocase subunit SecY [Lysinibacillus fusiformis]WCH47666.1 preprotein translocase subunit SecY [Lysinibacillus sp. OF-1]SCY71348.1 protein translocase subunit secY/sec61 alpha [Lysinibacillus sp. SG9]
MFQTISNFMRVRDIRNKIIFTLLMLIVFRIGTFIPVPNVDADVLKATDEFNLVGFLNTFGGGALKNFSIFAMGIMPYITASIIVQLLQMDVVPKFAEWAKQGEVGRRKLAQFTRYFTIILAFIQSFAMSFGFNRMYGGSLIKEEGVLTYVTIAIVLTAGTAFLVWLAEQITAHGVGNGISVVIFAGIVAALPTGINQIFAQQIEGAGDKLFINIIVLALLVLILLAVVVGVIYVQQALRKIPIQYAKRVTGRSQQTGGQQTHLPLKVNAAGVIPVIFSVAFLVTPQTLAVFFGENSVTNWITKNLQYTQPIGMTIYIILIVAFTYFYAFVQVNPENVADNLKKQGAYIPGIRPGENTQTYLTSVLYRLTFVGAIFLTVIAVMPILFINFMNLPASVQIGGTSIIIVVGVALETMKQLESQLVKRHYKGFMK